MGGFGKEKRDQELREVEVGEVGGEVRGGERRGRGGERRGVGGVERESLECREESAGRR